ncbi:hypothetical protein R6Q59_021655 [Mikania micrantha]
MDHLFFDCIVTAKIWDKVRRKTKWPHINGNWSNKVEEYSKRGTYGYIWSVVNRLVLGATVYYIWQERCLRQYENKKRSVEDVCFLILDSVRLRMLTLNFRNSLALVQVKKA